MNTYQLEVVRAGLSLLENLNTPKSLAIHLCITYGDWTSALSIGVDPFDYSCPDKFRRDSFAVAFFKKASFLPIASDRTSAAYDKWLECEAKCAETNSLIRRTAGFSSILHRAKNLISRVLPPLNEKNTAAILDGCRFGPGSSVGAKGYFASPHLKMSADKTLSRDMIHLLPFFKEHQVISCTREDDKQFVVTDYNELTFVPKTAFIDRPIAMEPTLNMYLQLGIGSFIRKRLRHVGIDLNSGQDLHRELVDAGSISGNISTIDLSSASDTIATELVRELLPSSWFILLDTCRSKYTKLSSGEIIPLEKFSSMGNGFTFELETLIFWALAKSQSSFCSVYGDDIIVDTQSFHRVQYLLEYCGLTLNSEKSFHEGYFRESCGADFFNGVPCRGIYVKEVDGSITGRHVLINQLYDYKSVDAEFYFRYLHHVRSFLIKQIPKKDRLSGPKHFGNMVITSDDISHYKLKHVDQTIKVLVYEERRRKVKRYGSSAVTLAMALQGFSSAGYSPRGTSASLRKRWCTLYGLSLDK